MKKSTNLIRLAMGLLFLSVIVVVQSQQVTPYATKVFDPAAVANMNDAGEPGDSYDPNYEPFVSQIEQKGIDGTDDLKIWVLPSAGATSGNTRAPGNLYKFQRTEYLILASDIAASGFQNGWDVSSIGFNINTAGVGTITGTLRVYLMNTSDVTYNLGANWTIAGFTQVSDNPSFTVPVTPSGLVYDETFVNGSSFTYTGGGVYVAWEFDSPEGTVGTIAVVHNCQTALQPGLYGQRSNTALPTLLVASNWRPATRFGTTAFDDIVAVTNVYTLGKVPVPYGTPTPVGIRVENVSAASASFDLTLEVRDVATNTLKYTSTQTGLNLAGSTAAVYNFTGWTPSTLEDVNVTGFTSAVTGETWTINNTFTELAQVNNNLFSYCYSNVPGSGYGFTTPNGGIFSSKYHMTGSGVVPSINIFMYNYAANEGQTIFAAILNSAGTIVAQTANYVIQASDFGTNKNFTFDVPVVFSDEDFYVGIGQTYISNTTQYYPLGIYADNPPRGNAFYNFSLTGGTPTATTAAWRFMIEAVVGEYFPCDPPTSLFASGITAINSTLNWTSASGNSQVEYGLEGFTPTGVAMYTGTSPLTITTAQATGYDFYVRDVCAGPIYSPWIKKTFSTFCATCTGTPEGEGQLVDGSDGSGINGGCAVGDPLLTTPIALGDTYCGESNTFLNDLGAESRDNDYYYLDLTSPTCEYWDITATLQGNSLVNLTLFNAADLDCNISAVGTFSTTTPCELATVAVTVPSGHYYVVARVATAAGNLWPAGSGPWQYVLTVNGSAQGAPVLDPVLPTSYTETLPSGGTTTQNLSIGNGGNYTMNYSAITTGTYSLVWEDMFDTYVADVQLALQNPTDWTTWSAAPGTDEDPYVRTSPAPAYSGANSFEVTGINDCVQLIGNYTTGSYRLSHRMYVEPGNVGYYNTVLTFDPVTPLYEWGMQVAFDINDTATLDAGVFGAAVFPYTPGTWMLNEVYVDLDNDYAEYWFNGTFIWSWQWSVGTGGYSTNQLAATNFFAYTGPDGLDNPLYYIDDYKIEVAGNDWLTINGGLGFSGSVLEGDPAANLTLGFDATGKAVGTYNKTINVSTNELCGAGSYSIDVTMYVGYGLTGNVYYGATDTKPMVTNTTVTLTGTAPVLPPVSVSPTAGGAYDIRPLDNGTYLLTGATTKAWGGSNTFDATLVLRYSAGVPGYNVFTNLQKRAADVNRTSSVNTFDATLISRRAASIPTPQWSAPDFVFDGPFPAVPTDLGLDVTVSGSNVIQVLRTLCSGDVNGTYSPWTP